MLHTEVCFGELSRSYLFSSQTMAASPTGFMTTVRSLDTPLANLVGNLVSGVLAPLLSGLRDVILSAVSFSALSSDAQCVVDGLLSSLPDATVLVAFLSGVSVSSHARFKRVPFTADHISILCF